MKTGIHNITQADYFAAEALHISQLKHMDRSPAHFLSNIKSPRKPSEAMMLGTAVHCAVFEPSRFNESYTLLPDVGPMNTKAGKDAMAKLCAELAERAGMTQEELAAHNTGNAEGRTAFFAALEAKGLNIITKDKLDTVVAMQQAVLSSGSARFFLDKPGMNEASAFWQDKQTGIRCCARFDKLIQGEFIVELKTTKDAREWSFAKDIHQYGYALQAAWYLWGAKELTGKTLTHVIIAVESEPPHGVQVYLIEDKSLMSMHARNRALLNQYAECKRLNEWPGYRDQATTISLPKYAIE